MRALLLAIFIAAPALAATNLTPAVTAAGYELLFTDKVDQARRFAYQMVKKDGRSVEGLVLSAVADLYVFQLDRAAGMLKRAWKVDQKSPLVAVRRGDLEVSKGNLKAAENHFRHALELDPELNLARLNLATVLIQNQRLSEGKELDGRAAQAGFKTPEEALVHVLNALLGGELDAASQRLADYRKRFAPNATSHYLEALTHLRRREVPQVRASLDRAASQGGGNPAVISQVASLYLALEDAQAARSTLEAAAKLFPSCERLAEQLKQVSARERSAQALQERKGRHVQVRYDPALPAALVDRIITTCEDAYEKLSVGLPAPSGLVKLTVLDVTGFSCPAYYNKLTGEIIAAGTYFRKKEKGMDHFVTHCLRHELVHLFLAAGPNHIAQSNATMWMDEGLAEALAGGIDYLREVKVNVKELFSDGVLNIAELNAHLNMTAGASRVHTKAYVQAYFMAVYLLESGDLESTLALLTQLGAGKSLEESLKTHFHLSGEAFNTGWQARMKRELK